MEADDGTTCIDKIMRKIDWKILKDIKLPIGKNKYLKRLDWYIIKKFLQSVQPIVCLYRSNLFHFQAGGEFGNYRNVLYGNEF